MISRRKLMRTMRIYFPQTPVQRLTKASLRRANESNVSKNESSDIDFRPIPLSDPGIYSVSTFAKRDDGFMETLAHAQTTLAAHQGLGDKKAGARTQEPKRAFRLPVTVHYFTAIGGHEDRGRRHPDTVVLDVGYLENDAFPQCFTVRMARATDYFWHWTHLCTPFSFRTIMSQQALQPGLSELQGEAGFRHFGKTLCELAAAAAVVVAEESWVPGDSSSGRGAPRVACGRVDKEEPACGVRVLVYEAERRCSLLFTETMSRVRTIPLLTLDFRPTSWIELKDIIAQHYRHIQGELKEAQHRLARLVSIIERDAPTLLVSMSCEQLRRPLAAAQSWYQQTNRLLFGLGLGVNEGTAESRREMPRGATSTSVTPEHGQETVYERLVFLSPRDSELHGVEPNTVKRLHLPASLEFHIVAVHPQRSQGSINRRRKGGSGMRYMVSVTDPSDPLFFMATTEISRDTWRRMMTVRGIRLDDDIGYLPEERMGGFVGVLRACLEQSHSAGRYRFKASLTEAKTPSLDRALERVAHECQPTPETGKWSAAQGCCKHATLLSSPSCAEPRFMDRTLTVDVVERSKYRSETFLTLVFRDVEDGRLQSHLARCIQLVEESFADVTHRLQAYTSIVRERKPALLLQMPKLGLAGSSGGSEHSIVGNCRVAHEYQTVPRDPRMEQRVFNKALEVEQKQRHMRLQELELAEKNRSQSAALWPDLLREGLYHRPHLSRQRL